VAGLAKAHEIGKIMSAALVGGNYVMNFIGGNIFAGLEAFFAKRVLRNIQVADGTPTPTVDFVVVW
jgi:hypothetical protein